MRTIGAITRAAVLILVVANLFAACQPIAETPQPTTLPGAASIVNAVCGALGVELFDLPVTPERLVNAMRSHDAS